jgi:hypothetical protein
LEPAILARIGVAALVVLVLGFVGLAVVIDDDEEKSSSVEAVLANAGSLMGTPVSVTGEVNGILSEHALTLGSHAATPDDLLVLAPDVGAALPDGAGVGSRVRVEGRLTTFTISSAERMYGSAFRENTFRAWLGEPAIEAARIAPSPQ